MAPLAELSTSSVVAVPPFQADTVPSSVTKMNDAGFPFASTKTVVLLYTWPLGAAGPGWPLGGAMVPTKGMMAPEPLYNVVSPVPLSEIQNGLPELSAIPHGSTRFGSVT